jgi:hypothetical protein
VLPALAQTTTLLLRFFLLIIKMVLTSHHKELSLDEQREVGHNPRPEIGIEMS